jgi:hypothetical protein
VFSVRGDFDTGLALGDYYFVEALARYLSRRDLPTNPRSRSGVCTAPMEGESRSQPTNRAE